MSKLIEDIIAYILQISINRKKIIALLTINSIGLEFS